MNDFSYFATLLFLLHSSFCLAEEVTVTTYYPSPQGDYRELRTTGNTQLATNAGSRVTVGTAIATGSRLAVLNTVGNSVAQIGGTTNAPAGMRAITMSYGDIYNGVGMGEAGYIQAEFQGTAYTSILLNPLGGNVAIGHLGPGSKLDVRTSDSNQVASYAYNTGAGSYGGIGWSSLGVHGYSPSNWGGYFQGATYGAVGISGTYWGVPLYALNNASGIGAYFGYGHYGMYTGGDVYARTYHSTSSRMYLYSFDGAGYFWIMSGGASEGYHNALGFYAGRWLFSGPGWRTAFASDLRHKSDVVPIQGALEKISRLERRARGS
jgi:hypothetical protein